MSYRSSMKILGIDIGGSAVKGPPARCLEALEAADAARGCERPGPAQD